jgi:colicin import membrane protein
MKGGLDAEIERLYQLPLGDFTAARNVLAKGAGKRAAEVRALVKPPVPAWAINQLYWKRRALYDALIDAAAEMRRAHAAVLSGRAADVRAAGKEHDARVAAALEGALEILVESGQAPTDATRQAIATTLRALPADEPAGLLTRTLQPGGFEALAGLSIRGAKAPLAKPASKPAPPPPPATRQAVGDSKALLKAREAAASAARALERAEHAAQREEFERARAAREADKAAKAVAAAKKAVEDAESELRDADAAAASATQKKEAAERRAQQAEQAVDAARDAAGKARGQLEALER